MVVFWYLSLVRKNEFALERSVRSGEDFRLILRSDLFTSLRLIRLAQTYSSRSDLFVLLRLIRLVYICTRFCSSSFVVMKHLLNGNMVSVL
jgi:hypothetical protein